MANHVRTSVQFHRINDEAKNRLKELYSKVRTDSDYQWFADMFQSDELSYEELEKYDWTIPNVGAKWCYFEDKEEDYFITESAWDAPIDGIERLLEDLSKYDPTMITVVQYEDEFPNFIGAAVYRSNNQIDSRQDEWDEIIECAMASNEELAGKFDAETGEWKDEESETFWYDIQWEFMNDLMDDFIEETLEYLK